MAIDKIPKVGKIYKTVTAAYNALKKGFTSQTKREPNPIEDKMIMEEAKTKIQAQGENISTLDTGIMSQASGTKEAPKIKGGIIRDNVEEVIFAPGMDKKGKVIKESLSQRQADLDRPFVTDEEMSAFTMEQNAKKLNRAKGFIDKLGAQSTRQKLFVADLVEDAGEGIFDNVDMGAVVRSNMFDDLIEQGVDDDLLTKIMYSDTKSDDFAITLAKIKSNAADEGIDIASGTGVDINETIDFYGRVFDEVSRVKKSMGGRIGFADGPDDPKKLIKKIPKVGKIVEGATSIIQYIKTLEPIEAMKEVNRVIAKEGPYKKVSDKDTDKIFNDTQDHIYERDPKPSEFDIDIDDEEIESARTLAPQMVERLQLKERFPGLDEELIQRILIDDNPQRKAEVIATIEESYKMLEKGMQPEDIINTFKNTSRSKNASGGLPHILGV